MQHAEPRCHPNIENRWVLVFRGVGNDASEINTEVVEMRESLSSRKLIFFHHRRPFFAMKGVESGEEEEEEEEEDICSLVGIAFMFVLIQKRGLVGFCNEMKG